MLVSAAELIQYMSNLNLNAPQTEEAQAILNGVQSELEVYCNRPLELAQVREAVRTDGAGYANLTASPIHKIVNMTSVEGLFALDRLVINQPIIPAPMERDTMIGEGGRLIDNLTVGVPYGDPLTVPGGVRAGTAHSYFVVEYIGGLDLKNRPEYEGVRTAIKRVAAREVGPLYDDTLSLREGSGERASEPDTREKGWTDEELARFDRLRRRVVW